MFDFLYLTNDIHSQTTHPLILQEIVHIDLCFQFSLFLKKLKYNHSIKDLWRSEPWVEFVEIFF